MTLDTKIYILDKVDPHEIFDFCNKELLKAENPIFTDGPSEWDDDKEVMHLNNQVGQGFNALLWTTYRKDKPLYLTDQYDEYTGEDGEVERWKTDEACYMKLSFDTAYGYHDEYGGPADLHARYIVDLYKYLSDKDVRIRWVNEFTGDTYDGIDGLDTLFSGGDKANEWYRNVVIPALPEIIEKSFPPSVDND